jgi:hypothetical protein
MFEITFVTRTCHDNIAFVVQVEPSATRAFFEGPLFTHRSLGAECPISRHALYCAWYEQSKSLEPGTPSRRSLITRSSSRIERLIRYTFSCFLDWCANVIFTHILSYSECGDLLYPTIKKMVVDVTPGYNVTLRYSIRLRIYRSSHPFLSSFLIRRSLVALTTLIRNQNVCRCET